MGIVKRFLSKVKKVESGCWEWQGSHNQKGYGHLRVSNPNRVIMAHRLAFALFKAHLPQELLVCHKCDNPKCCNPEHLFAGTAKDNLVDSARKGRQALKLTQQDVENILACNDTNAAIGRKYGVSRTAISLIKSGKNWNHVRRDDCERIV